MHAFVDESERGAYFIGAVFTAPSELIRLRKALRNLLKPGERRLHFYTESPSRRRSLLASFTRIGNIRARIYRSHHDSAKTARTRCLEALMEDLSKISCQRLVIESRDNRDHQDRQTIVKCRQYLPALRDMTYEHMQSYEDPLLWPADAILWAHGAGGEWRRRVNSMVESVLNVD